MIRLWVNNKIYKHLMWFFKKIIKNELQIIKGNHQFLSAQAELKKDLEMLEKGRSEFIELQQLDDELEATIRRHED